MVANLLCRKCRVALSLPFKVDLVSAKPATLWTKEHKGSSNLHFEPVARSHSHSTCPPEETATATMRSGFEIARHCSRLVSGRKRPAWGAVSLASKTADRAATLRTPVNKGRQPLTRRSHSMQCIHSRPFPIAGSSPKALTPARLRSSFG